jgi:hypothetical protein
MLTVASSHHENPKSHYGDVTALPIPSKEVMLEISNLCHKKLFIDCLVNEMYMFSFLYLAGINAERGCKPE